MTPPASAPADGASGLDQFAAGAAITTFAIGLGVGTVALPLLTIQAGYGEAVVGLLATASAAAQLLVRLVLPFLLRRFSDRAVTGMAALLQAASYSTLLLTTALPSFALAQVLQGTARGLFWTSSQTHAVRGPRPAVRALAPINLLGNFGQFIGPLLAGLAGSSFALPMFLAAMVSLVSWACTFGMRRYPPFERQHRSAEHGLWRRPGVRLGALASVTGGGWQALLSSYIPVILNRAGMPTELIGGLVSLGRATAIGVPIALMRLPARWVPRAVFLSVLVTVACLAVLPFVPGNAVLAGALLILSGLSAGALVILGPASASATAGPAEQGDVITLTGLLRAVAMTATPAVVAAMLPFIALAPAMALTGLAIGLPALVVGGGTRLAGVDPAPLAAAAPAEEEVEPT